MSELNDKHFDARRRCLSPSLMRKEFLPYHAHCVVIFSLVELSNGSFDKDDYYTILLIQFFNTRHYHLVCQVGSKINNQVVRDLVMPKLKIMGNGALQCYKWSLSTSSEDDINLAIENEIQNGRPPGRVKYSPEMTLHKFDDRHGICRAHMMTVKSNHSKVPHKVYIAFTGTRMDKEITWCGVLRQWLFVNLWMFPTYAPPLGWVHAGFNTLADHMLMQILDKLDKEFFPSLEEATPNTEVSIVGHSMGAAIGNLVALRVATKPWCCGCTAFTLATPSVFFGSVKIPDNTLLTSFVDKSDIVSISWPYWIYSRIGDTFVLKSKYCLAEAHTKSFEELFANFTFEAGRDIIVEYIRA